MPQQPQAVALRGSTLYVADSAVPVVRALDLATGDEPIVVGTGSAARPFTPPADDSRPATEVLLGSPRGLASTPPATCTWPTPPTPGCARWTAPVASRACRERDQRLVRRRRARHLRPAAGPRGPGRRRAGNLYIAEVEGRRVRKVDPSGMITTVAGNGGGDFANPGPVGDGTPATTVALRPEGIAVDGPATSTSSTRSTAGYARSTPGGRLRPSPEAAAPTRATVSRRRRPAS